jgi:hypothetical protein
VVFRGSSINVLHVHIQFQSSTGCVAYESGSHTVLQQASCIAEQEQSIVHCPFSYSTTYHSTKQCLEVPTFCFYSGLTFWKNIFWDTPPSSCLGIMEVSCQIFSFGSHIEWELFSFTSSFSVSHKSESQGFKSGE